MGEYGLRLELIMGAPCDITGDRKDVLGVSWILDFSFSGDTALGGVDFSFSGDTTLGGVKISSPGETAIGIVSSILLVGMVVGVLRSAGLTRQPGQTFSGMAGTEQLGLILV